LRHITLSALLNLALITGACASEDLSDVWRDLFTRCRIAVETGKDFDATGLRDLGRDVRTVAPVTAPGVPFPLISGYEVAEQRWEVPGSRFLVVEAEHPSNRGKSKRSCEIKLAQRAEPISTDEEKLLRATFLVERMNSSVPNVTNIGTRIRYFPPTLVFDWPGTTPTAAVSSLS
jgi:hypothetical protein